MVCRFGRASWFGTTSSLLTYRRALQLLAACTSGWTSVMPTLPRSFIAAPIDGKHHYKWSLIWRYDRPQALALVERGLKESLPIYALFVSQDQMITQQSRLPNVPGYEWRILNDSNDNAAILKLTAIGSDHVGAALE